ncbi:3-hydroxyacyl-CoA dehydrogenase NAD-binding domain-containing protein [Acinetobacter boissieri]|uniref:3-hydroxyacyl-CoA dehydrogenase n=1 Tax=Acinetobacter boissieri TaxID=1219383 RepID=A0A1G6I2C8_9GAMM|nr:3-hydroxyacyl-CoA dehydrogenase NAD-binding domain-containing protein [Acinetobacter boissieri]SDC00590.1 3-hydroxyacyl-CoA dehydrogenase [Acinetobacter boissieri]
MIYNGPAVSIQRLEHDIAALRFKAPQGNTPLFHYDFFNDLDIALNSLDNERNISGLLLLDLECPPATMCQYYQQQLQQQHIEDLFAHAQTQLNRIEDYTFPTVALIEQYTFGPMAEIALCCDYRMTCPQARMFFAAHTFGQSSALGASVRLPRLIGLEHAITTLQNNTPFNTISLRTIGLADAQISTNNILNSAIQYVQLKQQQPKPLYKVQPTKLTRIAQFMVFEQARALTYQQKSHVHYPAYKILLDTLEQSVNSSRVEAQQFELQAYIKINNLWQTPQLTIQACSQYITDQAMPPQLQHVATVVNSYQPWITDLLQHDLQVHIADTGQDFDYNTFNQALEQSTIDLKTSAIKYSRYNPLSHDIQCVFDLVAENINTKVIRLNQLQQQLDTNCIILVESPMISAQNLAEQLEQPEHVLVMHQMTSLHSKPLVELVAHSKANQNTVTLAHHHLQQLGKMPLLVNPKAGLFSQHILAAYVSVLSELIDDGIDFAVIDTAMQNFGFLEGPAKLLDRIGLKQYVYIEKARYGKQASIPKCIQYMVDQGHFGQTHDFGFYRYDNSTQTARTNHIIYDLLYSEQPFHVMEDQDIVDRFLIALCHATLQAINEGMVKDAQQADLALVHGFGFPDFYVGPCYYIQHIGFAEYIALCNRHAHLGETYHVPKKIKNMLATQQFFYTQGVV